jgi:tetratricopeptide (TPR) repeat protein
MHLELFLSHAPADDAFCTALASALRGAGAVVWDAPYTLSDGRLPAHTAVEVRHCPLFLVVLSPAALASEEVREACALASFVTRTDLTPLLLSVQAAPLPDQALAASWPFASAFLPTEGASAHPLPPAEAIQALDHIASAARWRALKAPPLSSLKDSEQALRVVRVLLAQERYREAAPLADHAVKLAPERFDTWAFKGGVQLPLRHGRQALVAAERALTLQPDNRAAWTLRTAALLVCKRPLDALQAADTALRSDATNIGEWNNRAGALRRLKRFDEALAAYDRALAFDPLNAVVWGQPGLCAAGVGQSRVDATACQPVRGGVGRL